MSKKRYLAACLAVLMAGTMFCSCSSPSGESSSGSSGGSSDSTADEPKDVTITYLYADNTSYPYKEDWAVFDWIKEATGVTLDLTVVPDADYTTKVPLMLNSADCPDILGKWLPQNNDDCFNGVYLAISDYEDQLPNYTAFLEESGMRAEIDGTRLSDGKYYSLPTCARSTTIQDQQWIIRADIFEKNNIPVPTTMDELYEAGKKLKELYPDSTPITNRFGSANIMAAFAGGFGTVAGWSGSDMLYDWETETWEYAPATENWKDMITYVNKLYTEGVLDEEYATLDSAVYEERIVNGTTFIMYDWVTNITRYDPVGKEKDPDFELVAIVPPKGPEGDYAVRPLHQWQQNTTLPAKVKDQDNFEDILRFIDWCYTDEAEMILTFGIEGETYEKNEEGRYVYLPDENGNAVDTMSVYGIYNNSLTYRQHIDSILGTLDDASYEAFEKIDELNCVPIPNPASPLSAEQNEYVSTFSSSLTDYVNSSMEQMIMGTMPLSDWDTFVQNCMDKGAQKMIDAYKEVATVKE